MVHWRKIGWMVGLLLGNAVLMPLPSLAQEAVGNQHPSEMPRLCHNLQTQFTLIGHLSPVNAIAVSADSKILVSGDESGVLKIWSLEAGQLLRSLAAYPGSVKAIAITPDGKSIVSAISLEKRDQEDDIAIKVWNLQTGKLIQSLTKKQGTVQTLDSSDAQTIIRTSEASDESSYEVKIDFVNRSTGNIIQSNSPATANQDRYAERDSLSTQDSSKKSAAIVDIRGYEDKQISFIKLQDLKSQKSICTVPKLGRVQNIIFSPDGQKLIVGGQKIEIMSLKPLSINLNLSGQQSKIQYLNRLGLDKLKRKQYYSAAKHFWQILELNRQIADEKEQIDTIYNIAEAYYALCQVGLYSCPIKYQGLYELILPYFHVNGDRSREAVALQRSKPREEVHGTDEESYQEALRKYRSLDDRKAEANTLVKIAWMRHYEIDNVQTLLKQAQKLYHRAGDRQGEIEVLHSLGISVSRMLQDKEFKDIGQRTPEAISYLQAAATLSREIGDRFLESTILLDLGDTYQLGKQYSLASTSYQQALSIRQSMGDDTGKAILLYRIAQTQHRLKQYAQAIEELQKTLTVCQAVENCLYIGREYPLEEGNASIFEELGETYFDSRQYPQALAYFQQLASFTNATYDWTLAKNLGLTHEKLGNYDLALKYFDLILTSRGPGGCGDGDTSDATIVEAIRAETGQRNFGCGSNVDTERWYLALSTATLHSGEIYRRRGQYAQAIAAYEKPLNPRREYNDATTAILFNNLGTLYKTQGNYNKARETYQKSLRIRQQIKDGYGEAVSLNNIGEIYRRQGQYPKALETYRQSFKIFQELTRSLTIAQAKITPVLDISTVRQGKASVLLNFGSVYYDLGEYDKALGFHNQSLSISKNLDDKAAQGRSLNNIGLIYEAQQQYTKALEIYQQALIARRKAEDLPGEAGTLNNIGLVHNKLGQPGQGIEPLQQALTIFKKLEDRASEANSLDSLGTLQTALGHYNQASEAYQNALRLVRESNLLPLEGVIFSNIGNLLVKTNQPELAIVFYKQSVNIRETIRQDIRQLPRESQESYTQSVAGTYRSLAALLIQQGRLPEAQAVLELLKLRELRDFTRDAGIDSPGINLANIETAVLKAILDRFTTLSNFTQRLENCQRTNCPDLTTLEAQRDTLNEAVNSELKQQRAILAKYFSTESATLTPEKLNAEARRIVNAQPGTVLIYPLVLKDKIQFLLALKAGDGAVTFRPIEVPDVSAQTLFETIRKFREQLKSPGDLKTLQATSKQLYGWLIRPLESELSPDRVKHLVFAPDSAIRYIPLAALYDGKQYLIERYSISTITAASQTNTTETFASLPVNSTFLLAMGASTFPNLSPLKNVPAELNAIVQATNVKNTVGIYPGSEFLDLKFDYEALKVHLKNKYRILHIATHGRFEPGRPEDSYLVPGRGQKLTTDRIDQLLNYGISNVHLVVLSACETAVGDRASDGIEIPGISYFFLKNEVKSVLASLWSVNDASTALLMQQFYKQLATGKLTKAEAIQEVQRQFIQGKLTAKNAPARSDVIPQTTALTRQLQAENFTHPYYWAPFILIGNSL